MPVHADTQQDGSVCAYNAIVHDSSQRYSSQGEAPRPRIRARVIWGTRRGEATSLTCSTLRRCVRLRQAQREKLPTRAMGDPPKAASLPRDWSRSWDRSRAGNWRSVSRTTLGEVIQLNHLEASLRRVSFGLTNGEGMPGVASADWRNLRGMPIRLRIGEGQAGQQQFYTGLAQRLCVTVVVGARGCTQQKAAQLRAVPRDEDRGRARSQIKSRSRLGRQKATSQRRWKKHLRIPAALSSSEPRWALLAKKTHRLARVGEEGRAGARQVGV